MSKESKGIFWSAIDHFSVQGIQFVLSIIIARLISPTAYGTVVMVQVFLSFAQLFIESGFKDALIQKKDRTETDFYTVFNFNLLVAFVLYGAMFILAPYIADFYNEPALINLTRVISLNLIFSSLSITQLVRLQINLDFKTLAKSRTIATVLGGTIGVICAYNHLEVWALVIQSIVSTAFTSILLMSFSRWKPRFVFDVESFKKLFSFGSKLLFTNFITLSYIQLTNLLIGKVYTPAKLAYYNRGFNISMIIPTSIINVMSRICFPIFCQLSDDLENLRTQYRKYIRIQALIVLPLMLIIAVQSKQIIIVLLTDKWIETASYLSVFCMVYLTQPILNTGNLLVLSVGRADLTAKFTVVKRVVTFGLLLITINISPLAVAAGLVINNIVECIITFYCTKKATGFSYKSQIFDIIDIIVVAIVAAAVAYIGSVLMENPFISLAAGCTTGLIAVICGMMLFKMKEINLLMHYLRH